MLHKCVVAGRCCPRLPDQEFCADPTVRQEDHHLYGNPYMMEAMGGPDIYNHETDEFSPEALALMYAPPLSDSRGGRCLAGDGDEHSDHSGDVNEWLQDVDELIDVPTIARPLARSASPGTALAVDHGASRKHFGPGPRGAGSNSGKRSPTPRRAVGDISEDVQAVDPLEVGGSPRKGLSTPRGASAGGRQSSPVRQSQAAESPQPTMLGSEVGDASIEVLRQCIKKAQCLPEQQRPASEKWVSRYSAMNVKAPEVGI
eukprot:gnl/TRDRNA2_/TRDRNA2_199211_c0_seq1.p1 gnl/TRDRNA2_/TRDRNA2_199211_c0~~gnl/TRDRNA2_/TRDRNA2_199211_c0_seq1.p1  ORF type:complete len:258 (-),score=40.78 gnl/TRDRNA2_/TRDRNA2_199211_c0_seq1:86-859(-)